MLKAKQFRVLDYSSNKIKIHSQVNLTCTDKVNKKKHSALFFVVDDTFEPLLGLKSCIAFGLIKRTCSAQICDSLPSDVNKFIEQHKEIFEGLGKCPGTCSIALKEGSTPSLHYKK